MQLKGQTQLQVARGIEEFENLPVAKLLFPAEALEHVAKKEHVLTALALTLQHTAKLAETLNHTLDVGIT